MINPIEPMIGSGFQANRNVPTTTAIKHQRSRRVESKRLEISPKKMRPPVNTPQ
jgi:hypothetical protein